MTSSEPSQAANRPVHASYAARPGPPALGAVAAVTVRDGVRREDGHPARPSAAASSVTAATRGT